jgi:hypothetical protein
VSPWFFFLFSKSNNHDFNGIIIPPGRFHGAKEEEGSYTAAVNRSWVKSMLIAFLQSDSSHNPPVVFMGELKKKNAKVVQSYGLNYSQALRRYLYLQVFFFLSWRRYGYRSLYHGLNCLRLKRRKSCIWAIWPLVISLFVSREYKSSFRYFSESLLS